MNAPADPPSDQARAGFSPGWPEVIVGASVAVILVFVLMVYLTSPLYSLSERLRMSFSLSPMKQLHLATQQMAMDGERATNPALGWPGDTGGSFSNWTAHLVQGNYLSTNDLIGLLGTMRHRVPRDRVLKENGNGILVYAVSTNSPEDTVFLSTDNFTNTPTGGLLAPPPARFAFNGFAVMRKAGDGALLKKGQAGDTNAVGGYAPLLR